MNTYATLYINTVRTYFLSNIQNPVFSELHLTINPIETELTNAILHHGRILNKYIDSSIATVVELIYSVG